MIVVYNRWDLPAAVKERHGRPFCASRRHVRCACDIAHLEELEYAFIHS